MSGIEYIHYNKHKLSSSSSGNRKRKGRKKRKKDVNGVDGGRELKKQVMRVLVELGGSSKNVFRH